MNFFAKRPLAVCSAVLILIVALSGFASRDLKLALLAAFVISALVLLFTGIKSGKNAVKYISALFLCAALGIVSGYVYYDIRTAPASGLIGRECGVTVRIDKTISENAYTHVYEGNILKADGEDVGLRCVFEFEYAAGSERGDIYNCRALFRPVDEYRDTESANYYRSNGLCIYAISSDVESCEYVGKADRTVTSVFADMRDAFALKLRLYLSNYEYTFCKAVFLGDRSELPYEVKENFSRIGISHMLALSGMHLTVLVGGLLSLLMLFGVKKKVSYSVSAAVCLFYVLLTGASFSVLRAGVMFATICLSQLIGRENDSVSSLFLAMALICTFAPYSVFNAGLLLSFSSTLGIVVILPEFNERYTKLIKSKIWRKVLGFVLVPVVTTLSAVTFSIPAFCVFFDYISAFTVIANIFISLPLTVILLLCPFLLLFSVTVSPLAVLTGKICSFIAGLILDFGEKCASIDGIVYSLKYPFVKYILAGMVLITVLLIIFRMKSALWYLAVFGAGIAAYAVLLCIWNNDFLTYETVTCLSNAHNDGVVITSCGKTLICDVSTGSRDAERAEFAALYDISYREKADVYVITHYHERTVENIASYVYGGRIGKVYVPVPKGGDELELYREICSVCNDCGVSCAVFGEAAPIYFGDDVITPGKLEKLKRSTHPVVTFSVSCGAFDFLYLGAAADECRSPVTDILHFDAVFAGGHGPKQKNDVFLPLEYDSLVCSEAAYGFSADKNVAARLDGWGCFTYVLNAEGLLE